MGSLPVRHTPPLVWVPSLWCLHSRSVTDVASFPGAQTYGIKFYTCPGNEAIPEEDAMWCVFAGHEMEWNGMKWSAAVRKNY